MRNPKSDRLERVHVVFFDVDGVFTDGRTWQDLTGQWRRTFSVRDTMGLRALRKAGFRVVVLTPVLSVEVRAHFERVGVDVFKDHCLEPESAAQHVLKSYGCRLDQAAFVKESGSGAVTLNMTGAPVYTTSRQGGDGAVFEICNLILQYTGQNAGSGTSTFQQSPSIGTKVGEL